MTDEIRYFRLSPDDEPTPLTPEYISLLKRFEAAGLVSIHLKDSTDSIAYMEITVTPAGHQLLAEYPE